MKKNMLLGVFNTLTNNLTVLCILRFLYILISIESFYLGSKYFDYETYGLLCFIGIIPSILYMVVGYTLCFLGFIDKETICHEPSDNLKLKRFKYGTSSVRGLCHRHKIMYAVPFFWLLILSLIFINYDLYHSAILYLTFVLYAQTYGGFEPHKELTKEEKINEIEKFYTGNSKKRELVLSMEDFAEFMNNYQKNKEI